MSELRTVASSAWHIVTAAAFAGAAAYAATRAASRTTAAAITELSSKVDNLAEARRLDYWAIYEQVQHDLLLTERLTTRHATEELPIDQGRYRRLLARLGDRRH